MRFTHPVNTLKKLGCGLAFGAAAIMAMPTSALACTQIYMGSKLTADGNTYYGRSEDFGPRYVKHFGIEPAHKDGNKYTSVESGFEYKSKGATYRYTFVRDNPSQWEDRYDAYSEAGINEKGVSCSATLSTSYNEKAEEADPITEETGIGEYNYASVILGESATAREGVELIGSLIDEQGVCSNDQIIIADSTETWLFAALSGHQWIAMKLAMTSPRLTPTSATSPITSTSMTPRTVSIPRASSPCLRRRALPSTPTASSTSQRPTARRLARPVCTSGRAISRVAITSWPR